VHGNVEGKDKIGVKPGWRVSAIGRVDQHFLDEIGRAVASLSIGRVLKSSDAIFLGATKDADLRRLATLKSSLKPVGALWVIRPKGRPEVSEKSVMAAGKAAGLVNPHILEFLHAQFAI